MSSRYWAGCDGLEQVKRSSNREVTVSSYETGVTGGGKARNIVSVRYWTEQMLTKRRAVDYCRVATALCRMA
ncbi:putative leader peptide [Actinocorallia sp. API 0066]|uniref:putative leader peptide n=1 Tax=Actinocorallia sp. API 0066 TaxID=2896846 RepID=UPI0035AC2365